MSVANGGRRPADFRSIKDVQGGPRYGAGHTEVRGETYQFRSRVPGLRLEKIIVGKISPLIRFLFLPKLGIFEGRDRNLV